MKKHLWIIALISAFIAMMSAASELAPDSVGASGKTPVHQLGSVDKTRDDADPDTKIDIGIGGQDEGADCVTSGVVVFSGVCAPVGAASCETGFASDLPMFLGTGDNCATGLDCCIDPDQCAAYGQESANWGYTASCIASDDCPVGVIPVFDVGCPPETPHCCTRPIGPDAGPDADTDNDTDTDTVTDTDTGGTCTDGQTHCLNDMVQQCSNGTWQDWTDCAAQGRKCALIEGAATCIKGGDTDSDTETDSEAIDDTMDNGGCRCDVPGLLMSTRSSLFHLLMI